MGDTQQPSDTVRSPEAPLFGDTFALCEWLLGRLDGSDKVLARTICGVALDLLSDVTLALKDRGREARVEDADQQLITLRVQLRLAGATGLLDEKQLLYALEAINTIGRQLGGWRRRLGAL